MTPDRAAVVAAATASIAQGSQSFAAASRLFAPAVREHTWLLYAWCRAADDITDGQDHGHDGASLNDTLAIHARLEALTSAALDGDADVPTPFVALRMLTRETRLPRRLIDDHLAGFALDAAHWRPEDADDLMRYCYHVAGSVGCMMAVLMGVDPSDEDTLDRASDLGIAFQLANIARDLVPDAQVGRCYVPMAWLRELGLDADRIADPSNRATLAIVAARLVSLARDYRASARVGAARLAPRCRLAVLAADAIYGAIGEKVVRRGERAWNERVRIGKLGKIGHITTAALCALRPAAARARVDLWRRPGQSEVAAGSRS